MKVGLILMASGSGQRFGGNKLLADMGGQTVAERTMDAYPPALFARAAVVSCHGEILALGAARGYLALPNPGAEEGVAASIRLGMAAMDGMDAVVFAVCDQPRLTRASVARLLAAGSAHPDRISALAWKGEKGNPCLFPARFFGELSALTGDIGGGAVIRAHPEALFPVEAVSAAELRDVDVMEDLGGP